LVIQNVCKLETTQRLIDTIMNLLSTLVTTATKKNTQVCLIFTFGSVSSKLENQLIGTFS